MLLQLASASLTLLIQSPVRLPSAQSAAAPSALGTQAGSAGMFALGFVQLQPTSPGVAQVGHSNITGVSRAGSFQGNGALLSALDAGAISSGTLNDLRLSSNIARLATAQVFSGQKTFSSAPIFSAAGAPFSVSSSTVVSNLNCDLLDGLSSSAFLQSIPVPLVLNNPVPNGIAIQATADNGLSSIGVYGLSAAGSGILGESTTGTGVYGYSAANAGVSGSSDTGDGLKGYSNAAFGVIGQAGAGTGVFGETFSQFGAGVWGINSSGGPGPGVSGSSSQGAGVQGYSNSPSSNGVYGENSGSGYGVFGRAFPSGNGVTGEGAYPGWGVVSYGDTFVQNDLYVAGSKVGYVSDIVRNVGSEPLEVGTLVEIVGASAPVLGRIPVIDVRKASSRHARAALGPVAFALNVEPWTHGSPSKADGTAAELREPPRSNLHRQEGAIAPGFFGSVVTLGSFEALAVDAAFGAVMPGDLLVASPNPGYAMVSSDPLPGTLVGKALGTLDFGTGQVAVLVKGD